MDLSKLRPAPGSTRRIKRIGRGIGSGHGKTSGRGHKGLGSRSHGKMPLKRRLPKHGFRRLQADTDNRERWQIVNLERLAAMAGGATIDPDSMAQSGLVRKGSRVKVLGDGELKGGLTVRAHAFSKSALEKIAAAGGSAEVIPA
jgi:large subunit ribosomal protein L15